MFDPRFSCSRLRGTTFVLFVSCGLFVALASATVAQEQCTRIVPIAVAVGATTELTAEGKFDDWPVQLYCDRSDVALSCLADKGKIQLQVPPGASPGVIWIRLFDQQNASKLMPLLVETGKVQNEAEPNEGPSDAQAIDWPVTLAGRLQKRGDVDCFKLQLQTGERFSATLSADQPLAVSMDSVLQLCDEKGNVLHQSDDRLGLDPGLTFVSDQTQTVILRVFAFPKTPNSTIGFAGSDEYVYALRLRKGSTGDHMLPLVVGNTQPENIRVFDASQQALGTAHITPETPYAPITAVAQDGIWQVLQPLDANYQYVNERQKPASAVQSPVVFSGRISDSREQDEFHLNTTKGNKYRATVWSQRLGYKLDPKISVIRPSDKKVLVAKDDLGRNQYDAEVEWTAQQDEDVILRIEDATERGGARHVYAVAVEEQKPKVSLAVATEHFVLTPGKALEIPVSVVRSNGHATAMSIQAIGLPEEFTSEAVVSEGKGDSAKKVTLKLALAKENATLGELAPILCQISGKPKDGDASSADKEGSAENLSTAKQILAQSQLRPGIRTTQLWLSIAK